MSWLGDRFSTLTNQLSTLTNEVLLEGREEIDDRAAELQLSQQRIKELERQNGTLRREVEQLRATNVELEERQHASELRLAHCRRELRLREEEIQRLSRQNRDEEVGFRPRLYGDGERGEFDYSDLDACQREIRRLTAVVARLRGSEEGLGCRLPAQQDGCGDDRGSAVEGRRCAGEVERNHSLQNGVPEAAARPGGVASGDSATRGSTEALREENRRLERSLEELDRQNQEALTELLSIKAKLTAENKQKACKIETLERELRAARGVRLGAEGDEKEPASDVRPHLPVPDEDTSEKIRDASVQTETRDLPATTDRESQTEIVEDFGVKEADAEKSVCEENQKDATTEKSRRESLPSEADVEYKLQLDRKVRELEECRHTLRVETEQTKRLRAELEQAKADASRLAVELRLLREAVQTERKQEAEETMEREKERLTRLEAQMRSLLSEKEQILTVMNEKSRESSSLKAEVHHLMAVVTAERQAAAKLRAENAELRRGGGAHVGEEGKDLAREALHKLSQLVRDRELELDAQKQKVATLLQLLQQASPVTGDQMQELLEEREELACQVATLQVQQESDRRQAESAREEVRNLADRLQEESLRMQELQLQHDSARLQAEDRHKALRNAQNETVALRQRVADLENRCTELVEECRQLREAQVAARDESVRMQAEVERLRSEREKKAEEAKQQGEESAERLGKENGELLAQVERLREKDEKQLKELERLRSHLLHVEESYTREALQAEQREKDLRARLLQLEDWARASTSAVHAASAQASHQVESLQQQLTRVTGQRDAALDNVSSLEDQLQEHAAALANLQLVLEQFQKEKERDLQAMRAARDSELALERERSRELAELVRRKEEQLSQTTDALEAAARLSEQLDFKEEIINSLREEVRKKETELAHAREETTVVRNTTEGKVDKQVMKSLVLGYFATPAGQRPEVVRLLARILDFSREEMEKAGIHFGSSGNPQGGSGGKGWISSLWWRSRSPSGSETVPRPLNNQSFSALFIKFLEEESRPQHGVRLPIDGTSLGGPSRAIMPPPPRKTSQQGTPLLLSPGDAASHPLLQPVTLPTFAPVAESQSAFLQQVLK